MTAAGGSAVPGREVRPAVSVVVLACDATATIRRCLASLAAQETAEPFEVVVVWSGERATAAIVAEALPSAVTAGFPQPLATGAARNVGIRLARGGVVAFLAADCEVPSDWVSRRAQAHRAGHGCVGGAVVCAQPAGPLARAAHMLEYNAAPVGRPREVVRGQTLYNLSFRREVFERHGAYDDALACGEDTAFNWRLVNAGEPALFDPAIRLVHHGEESLGRFLRHQSWHGGWFGRLCRDRVLPGFAAGGVRAALQMLVLYPLGRLVRLVRRTLRWSPEQRRDLVLLAPLLVLGLAAATYGLVRGWRGWTPPR